MAALLVLLFYAPAVGSAAESYYYVQVSSFREEKRAVTHVKALEEQGYDAVANRERVPSKGYWYRVYIGPFLTLEDAKMKRKETIDRNISKHPLIKEKESVIKRSVEKPPEKEEIKVPAVKKKEVPPVSPPQAYVAPPREKPVEVPPPPEKPPEEKEVLPEKAPEKPTELPEVPPPSEKPPEKKEPPPEAAPLVPEKLPEAPPAPEKPPAVETMPPLIPSPEERAEIKAEKGEEKPPREKIESMPRGQGRNMGKDHFSLGLKHTYRSVSLDLTKRRHITSDGSDTAVRPGGDYFTKIHMDSLRARYGVTDYLEVFAEIGLAYKKPSDLDFAYGGGVRLNLFQMQTSWLADWYGALQGEFLNGEVSYEYDSTTNDTWKKSSEWEELIFKGELGLIYPRFTAFIGVVYFDYQEETERKLLEDLPPLSLRDELEGEESLGFFAGVDIPLRSQLLLAVEGQIVTQKSILGKLEYHF